MTHSELDTPETDRFATDGDAAFGQKVLYIPVAQVEAIVEPDRVGDDIGRESVTFIGIHPPILPIWGT